MSGPEYVPIMCDSADNCGCKRGHGNPQCSRCPNDEGSPTTYENVCWCTNFWWDGEEFECNSKGDNGPFRVDNNGRGSNMGALSLDAPYKPIECYINKQCGCIGGIPKCSQCPGDDSSEFQAKDACWCDDAFDSNSGAQECNPANRGGPFKIDVGEQGFSYNPIVCGVNSSQCI